MRLKHGTNANGAARLRATVDARGSSPYVRVVTNLLLLLSALLSALTGVSAGGRAVEPRAVAERVVSAPVASRIAVSPRRPASVAAPVAVIALARVTLPPPPATLAPLYLLRRRE